MISGAAIKSGIKAGGMILKKYLPSILIGAGIASMSGAIIVAVKKTPDAYAEIELQEADELKVADMMDRPPRKDLWRRAKILGKYYWVPATMAAIGATSIVFGALDIHRGKLAALALASASQKELADFKEQVLKIDGEKKLDKINDAIAEKNLQDNPSESKEVIFTGRGEHLCYDAWSGRYFYSDIEKVRRAELDLNRCMLRDGYYSLNDFYDSLGLPHTDLGDQMGWHCDALDHQVEINFSSKVTDKGEPCLVIRFDIMPKYEFDSYS